MSKYSEKVKKIIRYVADSKGPIVLDDIVAHMELPSKESLLGARKIRHTVADLAYSGVLDATSLPNNKHLKSYTLGHKGQKIVSEFHAPLPTTTLRGFGNIAEISNTNTSNIIPKENDLIAPPSPAVNNKTKTVSTLEDSINQSIDKFNVLYDNHPDEAVKLLAKQVILLREEVRKLRPR